MKKLTQALCIICCCVIYSFAFIGCAEKIDFYEGTWQAENIDVGGFKFNSLKLIIEKLYAPDGSELNSHTPFETIDSVIIGLKDSKYKNTWFIVNEAELYCSVTLLLLDDKDNECVEEFSCNNYLKELTCNFKAYGGKMFSIKATLKQKKGKEIIDAEINYAEMELDKSGLEHWTKKDTSKIDLVKK